MQDLLEHNQDDERIALLVHAFNNVDEAIFLADENANFVRVNEKACQSLGYTREELLSMQIFDIDPDFKPENWQQYKDARAVGSPSVTFETRHKTKDGRIFFVEVSASCIPYQGRPYSMSLVRDISHLKQYEEELLLLNHAFNQVNEAIFLTDEEGRFSIVNEKASRNLGYTREELLGMRVFDIDPNITQEDFEKCRVSSEQKFTVIESHHKTKDGCIFPVEVSASHISYQGKNYGMALVRDISERKEAEKQFALLNYALDHVGEAAWLIDENTKFHYNNAEASRAIGYSREELLELGVPDIDPLYQLEVWPEHWQDLKTHGSLTFESLHKTKDDRIFPVEINANYFEFDGQGYNLALIRDITERKATEKQLNLLNFALDHVKESVWLGDENGKIQYVNQEACHSTGYTRDELLQLSVSDVGADFPIESWVIHWQELKASNAIRLEIDHKTKDGHIFPVEVNANYFEFEGQGYNLALSHDITERKQAQEALQRSESLLAEAQRIAHIGSWEVDIVHNQLFWSDETFRIWEIDKSQFAATIEAFYETVHPEDREKVTKSYNASIEHLTPYQVEHRLLFPDGRVKYIAERGEVSCDENGNRIRFVGTSLDITERTLIELERAEKEQQFRVLAETLPSPVFRFNKECRRIYMNPTAEKISGISAKELLYKKASDSSPLNVDELKKVEQTIELVLKTGKPQKGDVLFRVPATEQIYYFHNSYAPEFDAKGEVTSVIVISHDITERKQMEEKLRQREQEFRVLVETSPSPIIRYDTNCRRIYVNPAVEEMSGKTKAELLAHTPTQGTLLDKHVTNEIERILQYVIKTGRATEGEAELVLADGQTRHFHNRYAPELDANGNVMSVVLVGHDITERKLIEEQFAAREREFRMLAENMPDNLLRYNAHGRVYYMNSSMNQSIYLP